MTPEELAIKYGLYHWDNVDKCYVVHPIFIDDVQKVIAAQQRSFVAMYMIMRTHMIGVNKQWHNAVVAAADKLRGELQMWRDIQEIERV